MFRRLLLLADGVLIVVAVLLAVRLHGAWVEPVVPAAGGPTASAAPAATPPAPSHPAATRPPLAAFGVVADRNLFSATRTETPPEPPRPATAAAPAPPAPRPRLYGVVMLPDGKSRAYLEDIQRRKVFGYSVGDAIADSRVEQIKSDRVVLRRGAELFEVLLRDPSKPKAPPTPGGPIPRVPGVPGPLEPQASSPGGVVAPIRPGPRLLPTPTPGGPQFGMPSVPGAPRRPPLPRAPGSPSDMPRPETPGPGTTPDEDEPS